MRRAVQFATAAGSGAMRVGPQDEQDAVQYFPPIAPASAAAVLAALRLGNEIKHCTLKVSEISQQTCHPPVD
jgi:hypothetical protein